MTELEAVQYLESLLKTDTFFRVLRFGPTCGDSGYSVDVGEHLEHDPQYDKAQRMPRGFVEAIEWIKTQTEMRTRVNCLEDEIQSLKDEARHA